jgi:predicted nucleic acid-binding protein
MAAFVDTNILIYALSNANQGETEKVSIARRLVDKLSQEDGLILSAQVLSEFISVSSRKGKPPLTEVEVSRAIGELCQYTVIAIDAPLVQLALQRVQQSLLSYWDALIVEAAISSDATILYTEDMHHGTRYGTLELRNPFLA